jgi:nucleotide-binding universal stress UspA family protein
MAHPDTDVRMSAQLRVPFGALLCPTDLSKTGNVAVAVAYQLVGPNGRVHLLHVCEPPYLGNPVYGPYVQGYAPTPEDTQSGEEKILRKLHRLVPEDALERGIRTEFHLVHGVDVAKVIAAEAKRFEAEVVVLGTHGRTGLGRILMGSVATDVVKKKGLPAILVHPDLVE